jgi:ribonuclease P protein component
MRVRRFGKSYAHPLLVLILLPNENDQLRCGISSGRAVGKAVERNRAKRLLREIWRSLLPELSPGWDVILIARHSLAQASYEEAQAALLILLKQANLLNDVHAN